MNLNTTEQSRIPSAVPSLIRIVGVLSVLCLAHCAGSQHVPTATSIGQQYLYALSQGRADDAWNLMTAEARRTLSKQEHRRRVNALTQQQRTTLRTWGEKVQSHDGNRVWRQGALSLRMTQMSTGRWSVVRPISLLDKAETPRTTLLLFHNAFTNRDYATMLQMAPEIEQGLLSVSLLRERFSDDEFATQLETALDVLVTQGSGRATENHRWLIESGRHLAILKRENDQWRIIDVR